VRYPVPEPGSPPPSLPSPGPFSLVQSLQPPLLGAPQPAQHLRPPKQRQLRPDSPIGPRRPLTLVLLAALVLGAGPGRAYVALMAGQQARPLVGKFNTVPVLHSNQPEEVLGAGILVNTMPGQAYSSEINQSLDNATYTFNGDFGLHIHHKYNPTGSSWNGALGRREELTLAAILINPGDQTLTVQFDQGSVRNSFDAPYLPNNLMGVKPLGPRPWNTGPGDATAIAMLRGKLDANLPDRIVIPPRGRAVLFQTQLPANGIANGLLRGRSDGPLQVAVVAARQARDDNDILAVLDSGQLAPGRTYLRRLREIEAGYVFSRVAGVAIGDTYQASLNYDLNDGPLHVPLTSTVRHNFGTDEIQVNPLASRMVDSSLNNVGTYGVRFDITLNLKGSGPYELVLSHPSPNGRNFTAFRGSIGISTDSGYREVHVGLRSGESLSLTPLELNAGQTNPVRVTLVYPADATPGHLLSVVPSSQLARVQDQLRQLALAQSRSTRPILKPGQPPLPAMALDPMAPVASENLSPIASAPAASTMAGESLAGVSGSRGIAARSDLPSQASAPGVASPAAANQDLAAKPTLKLPALGLSQPSVHHLAATSPKPRIKANLAGAGPGSTHPKAAAPAKPKPLVAKLPTPPAGPGSLGLLDQLVLPALPPLPATTLPAAPGPVEWQGPAPAGISPARMSQTLMERYQQALENQQLVIKSLGSR